MPASEEAKAPSWVVWVSKASDWRGPHCVCVVLLPADLCPDQPGGEQEVAVVCVPLVLEQRSECGLGGSSSRREVKLASHLGSRFFLGTEDRTNPFLLNLVSKKYGNAR